MFRRRTTTATTTKKNDEVDHELENGTNTAQSADTSKTKASSFTDNILNIVIVLVVVVSFCMAFVVLSGIATKSATDNTTPEAHPFIADVYKQSNNNINIINKEKEKNVFVADFETLDKVSQPKVPMLHNQKNDVTVNLTPIFGHHRPSSNAVLALAAGYGLNTYIQFIGSLRQTGYDGDIVLATDTFDKMTPSLKHYLQSDPALILYHLEADCKDGRCQLKNFFYNITSKEYRTDVRIHRPFATLRYDAYWFWSTRYHPHSKLLLVDSRDVVFQSNPFQNIPTTETTKSKGTLHFYEEKMPIHTSSYNMRWLRSAGYSDKEVNTFKYEKILCSGVSIGEQIAMEAYLQTILHEFDKTQCINHGCDQGLHNYIYYSHTLHAHPAIDTIEVHAQGKSDVNNLAGLRHENKPLRELGVVVDEGTVVNDDGSVPAIAHQVDRDQELAAYFRKKYSSEAKRVEREYSALQQAK